MIAKVRVRTGKRRYDFNRAAFLNDGDTRLAGADIDENFFRHRISGFGTPPKTGGLEVNPSTFVRFRRGPATGEQDKAQNLRP